MSTPEHDKSQETGKQEFSESTDRPEGSVAEGANPPLTDPTETDVDRNPELIPPQETEPACRLTRDAARAPQKREPLAAATMSSKPRINCRAKLPTLRHRLFAELRDGL